MELKREEVVSIYNFMKGCLLGKMPMDVKKTFVVNIIKLKSVAEKIITENTEVIENYSTDEYKEALKKYLRAKEKYEKIKGPQISDMQEFKAAELEFAPIFNNMEKEVGEAIKNLDQTFEINIVDIPMEGFLQYLDALPDDYTFDTFSTITKLIK